MLQQRLKDNLKENGEDSEFISLPTPSTCTNSTSVFNPAIFTLEMSNLKRTTEDLRDEVFSMRSQFITNHDLQHQIRELENEKRNLQAAIELLNKDKLDHSQHHVSRQGSNSERPDIERQWTTVNNKRQPARLQQCAIESTAHPIIPLPNRFNAIPDQADELTPEEVLNQYTATLWTAPQSL